MFLCGKLYIYKNRAVAVLQQAVTKLNLSDNFEFCNAKPATM